MPLFGTGQGRRDPVRLAERLVREAIDDLSYHASVTGGKADLEVVLFSAFTEEHVKLLFRVFEGFVEKGALRRAGTLATERQYGPPTT